MQHYRKIKQPGATFFFTLATYQRRKILDKAPYYQALKSAISAVRKTHPFTIEAFVLLPDHLHCIWTMPSNDCDYAIRWGLIKNQVSRQEKALTKTAMIGQSRISEESGFWERRVWKHQIGDDKDYAVHVDYIHWNPVKHGYVSKVNHWPYSSFHKFVKKGVYPPDWSGMPNEELEMSFGEF